MVSRRGVVHDRLHVTPRAYRLPRVEEPASVASVHDVAAAVVERTGDVDTWKLQKLVYYCQAWHLVWHGCPLFSERIEAWAGGPVVRDLYERHRGQFKIQGWSYGDPGSLSKAERNTVKRVLGAYGHLSGRDLRRLTHSERPWRAAREGLGPSDRSSRIVDLDEIVDFYSGLIDDEAAVPVEEIPKREDD